MQANAIKTFGDHLVASVDKHTDDEFQTAVEHKSNTVALGASYFGTLLATTVGCWVLPTSQLWFLLVVLLPLVLLPPRSSCGPAIMHRVPVG